MRIRTDPETEINDHMSTNTPLSITTGTYPADLLDRDHWLTWKATDGRKIPRAPYEYPGQPDRFVDAQDPDMWTDFETAREWASKLTGFGAAYVIRDRDEYPDEDLVLIDYDHVRDPESGAIHPTVREHIEAADSYADVSTSGTGVHILCRGALPDGVQTISDTLPATDGFPNGEIEVYDTARYVAMTGQHIEGTPAETRGCQSFIETLATEYATVTANRPDGMRDDPPTPPAELADIDTTTDIQDVYDAISQTRPADIRLRSTVTEERSDGSKSLDPCWTHSASGTRLAQVDEGWIYRDGMISLDALQVVALEEGIIADERAYPDGSAFWDAVEALRDRGAHIPRYEPDGDADADTDARAVGGSAGHSATTAGDTAASGSSSAAQRPARSTGDPTDATAATGSLREHELNRLRTRVSEQRATIDELETTIEELRAQLEQREAEVAALRADDASPADDDQEGSDRSPPSRPWGRVKRWFADRLSDRGRIDRRTTGE